MHNPNTMLLRHVILKTMVIQAGSVNWLKVEGAMYTYRILLNLVMVENENH